MIFSRIVGFCCLFALSVGIMSEKAHGEQANKELRILTDRTESHLKNIFAKFEQKTGIKISASFMDAGIIERLAGRPTDADLLITKDADLLVFAKQKNLLQAFKSELLLNEVPSEFRDKDNKYFVDAYRARVILYAKDKVKPEDLSTYEDLANAKWKKKICIRSGMHDYNLALFGQFIASYGEDKTKAIIAGLHANLGREPKGNDREQAKGIFEGKCEIALINNYYYPMMLMDPVQKEWATNTRVFFPNQKNSGTFIMRSGLALTKAKTNIKAATQFLEFMASKEAQDIMVNTTFQYPVNKQVKFHDSAFLFGAGQPEIKDGVFKINIVELDDVAKYRERVIKMLNDTHFDSMP